MTSASAMPPGPGWSPAQATLRWMVRPVPMLEACRARYGDAFTVRFLHEGTTVLVSHPEDLRRVFTAAPTALHAGEGRVLMKPFFGENSVLVVDEDFHREQRRQLLPPFHGERLEAFVDLMAAIARAEFARCEEGRPIRLAPRLRAIALEVMVKVVFGSRDKREADEMSQAMMRLLDLTSSIPRMLPLVLLGPRVTRWPSVRRLLEDVDLLIYRAIASRRLEPGLDERSDVLSMLLGATDGEVSDATALRDQLMTLLIAGHETTATGLSWAIERLARAPQVMERLREEAATGEDAYLDAVVKEILRVGPIFPVISRLVMEPFELRGHTVQTGAIVAACPYLTHHDAALYPDPYGFRPERFLGVKPGTYTWIPFGGGVRRCVGASFAMTEIKTVLRVLSQEMRIRPADPRPERILRRTIAFVPNRGCEVVLERLKPAIGSAAAS